MITKSAETAHV